MANKKTHNKKKAPIAVRAHQNAHGTITRAHDRVAEVNADEIVENQERASSAAKGVHAMAADAAVGLATVGMIAATAPISAGPVFATALVGIGTEALTQFLVTFGLTCAVARIVASR